MIIILILIEYYSLNRCVELWPVWFLWSSEAWHQEFLQGLGEKAWKYVRSERFRRSLQTSQQLSTKFIAAAKENTFYASVEYAIFIHNCVYSQLDIKNRLVGKSGLDCTSFRFSFPSITSITQTDLFRLLRFRRSRLLVIQHPSKVLFKTLIQTS